MDISHVYISRSHVCSYAYVCVNVFPCYPYYRSILKRRNLRSEFSRSTANLDPKDDAFTGVCIIRMMDIRAEINARSPPEEEEGEEACLQKSKGISRHFNTQTVEIRLRLLQLFVAAQPVDDADCLSPLIADAANLQDPLKNHLRLPSVTHDARDVIISVLDNGHPDCPAQPVDPDDFSFRSFDVLKLMYRAPHTHSTMCCLRPLAPAACSEFILSSGTTQNLGNNDWRDKPDANNEHFNEAPIFESPLLSASWRPTRTHSSLINQRIILSLG